MTGREPLEIAVRPSTLEDVPSIVQLIEPFVIRRTLLPRSESDLVKLIDHGFVAVAAGRIVGFACIEIYSSKLAEVQCLAVATELHGQGIGRRLVECCVQRARDENVYELMVITASDQFLKSCGFDYSLPDQKRAMFVRTGKNDL